MGNMNFTIIHHNSISYSMHAKSESINSVLSNIIRVPYLFFRRSRIEKISKLVTHTRQTFYSSNARFHRFGCWSRTESGDPVRFPGSFRRDSRCIRGTEREENGDATPRAIYSTQIHRRPFRCGRESATTITRHAANLFRDLRGRVSVSRAR